VLPRRRPRPVDTRMDRQERGSRHAVLQPRPGRTPERARPPRQTLVEGADAPPEREDLRPRQLKPGGGHASPLPRARGAISTTSADGRIFQEGVQQPAAPEGSPADRQRLSDIHLAAARLLASKGKGEDVDTSPKGCTRSSPTGSSSRSIRLRPHGTE
jgi:hypothetical protein